MASIDEFRVIVETVETMTAPDAELVAVEVLRRDGGRSITLRTPSPGPFIGRRGQVADAIRTALVDSLDEPGLRLNITSTQPDDPGTGSGGVREPRRPNPTAPSQSTSPE